MILIRFSSPDAKALALGLLPGRFSFKSWATGEMILPEPALVYLARKGVSFTVEGPASDEQIGSAFRGAPAPSV